jgi:hypothetical protein
MSRLDGRLRETWSPAEKRYRKNDQAEQAEMTCGHGVKTSVAVRAIQNRNFSAQDTDAPSPGLFRKNREQG